MIVLLGASGYVGSRFQVHLNRQGVDYAPVSRADINIFDHVELSKVISDLSADFLINSAGFTGKPNVDACEDDKSACLMGNAVLPGVVAKACKDIGIPFGHVSSGCLYSGRRQDGGGFTEEDSPNFSFRQNNCSFYSGTKALGEEVLSHADRCYIWRLRMPFHSGPHHRNYLHKLMTYERLLEAENSLSELDEFVNACIDSYRREIPFGTYNLTNPGSVLTNDVTRLIEESGLVSKKFLFFRSEQEFMRVAAKAPRSNCVLDSSKAIAAGLQLSPVEDAIRNCLANWQSSECKAGLG